MTEADVIRLARLADYPLLEFDGKKHVHAALLRMLRLAQAEVREACARACEHEWVTLAEKEAGQIYAAAIRSGSEA